MSETDTAGHTTVDEHVTGEAVGHDAGHGHGAAGEPLGPPDLMAWAYALTGGAVGLVVALALWVAAAA
jgi:hypothetical protein